jgi:hypothetical protein
VSRLATIAGALSAIVTLGDYLFARSFLSHWLQHQIGHDATGWRITPTLNLIFIAGLVGLVWLATESSSAEPEVRKRLFRLRANVVIGGLLVWFFFGPSIGDVEVSGGAVAGAGANPLSPPAFSPPPTTAAAQGRQDLLASQGMTSQFTWKRPPEPVPARNWRPGDGLRAMAHMLEDAAAPLSRDTK